MFPKFNKLLLRDQTNSVQEATGTTVTNSWVSHTLKLEEVMTTTKWSSKSPR